MEDEKSFRDSIATVNDNGGRNWLYPKKVKGRYFNKRRIVNGILLVCLFIGPFIKVGGQPFFLFNLLQRKFILFGVVFWPQDFSLFVLAMITAIVFVVLFTVVFGRIWCGWICPQTIFMEMVFRRIEYWIEGDARKQKKLNKQQWGTEKIRKKGLKFIIFYLISFLIANIFLAYIIGSDALLEIITDHPKNHVNGLISIFIFSGIFYWVFAWFREQVCIIACPYGRLQGVMIDKNTIVVAYDYLRGEKRGRLNKNEKERTLGDCVDCNQCVEVCPTGIDIRNGTQLECINCTACMDVCDNVMNKSKLPEGLIRYTSEENIEKGESKIFNNRVKSYSMVLLLLISLLVFFMMSRSPIATTILRAKGQIYQVQEETISNLYTFNLLNKTMFKTEVNFKLHSHKGIIQFIGENIIVVKQQDIYKGTMFIYLYTDQLKSPNEKLTIGVYKNDVLIEEIETSFLVPNKKY
jgi:cytochrome c oxidase accessory protein FixG